MCMPLPTGDFRFLSETEISQFDLKKVTADSEKGYILEVDLENSITLIVTTLWLQSLKLFRMRCYHHIAASCGQN